MQTFATVQIGMPFFRLSLALICLACPALAHAQPFELPYTLSSPAGDGPGCGGVPLEPSSALGGRAPRWRFCTTPPYVDAKRIAVRGGSHGGSSTLATIVDTPGSAGEVK